MIDDGTIALRGVLIFVNSPEKMGTESAETASQLEF
jgi:hypothetical protein